MTPLREGAVFCVMGDAGRFQHESTRIKEHTHTDTGGIGWASQHWDHWPIGWLNSQAHEVDADSLRKYPNHFSPMGMDCFAVPDALVERRDFYSLIGVGSPNEDLQPLLELGRAWLQSGGTNLANLEQVAHLAKTFKRE